MNPITVTCPHCGHTKDVDPRKIPADVKSALCRACERSFPFSHRMETDAFRAAVVGFQEEIPFVFTGKAREYFGIWIVNTLLKIVTLGIYSPWAKVRKRQYFYGNTQLDGENFDYMANPLVLLKGLLIAAVLFICYTVGSNYSPMLGIILGILFFLLMPWVIVRSRLFNNRNSAHRNIRFNFRPAYGEAYAAYAWLPILTPFTGGLLFPYVYYRQRRFLMENNLFGTSRFTFKARGKDFYFIALKTLGLGLLLIGGLAASTTMLMTGLLKAPSMSPVIAGIATPLAIIIGYFLVMIYAYVRTVNLTWNSTLLGENHFVSSLRARDMSWILLSNLAAVILSFGLLVPWASIRLARYRLNKLIFVAHGDLDHFRAAQLPETSAVGEEIGDIFDIDVAF